MKPANSNEPVLHSFTVKSTLDRTIQRIGTEGICFGDLAREGFKPDGGSIENHPQYMSMELPSGEYLVYEAAKKEGLVLYDMVK